MTDLPALRDVITRHGLDARRSLGQHFLLDINLTSRIVRFAGDLTGCHVIEVGPGPGGLTRPLLESAAESVTVIEIDPRAVAVMRELEPFANGRLRIVEADARTMDPVALTPEPRHIVANLPYNVATPLLIGWLRTAVAYRGMTLMFQDEVAERICAAPNTEAYGRLSVLAQWICETDVAMRIPPTAFIPPPKIWSAVVNLNPRPIQPTAAAFSRMERLTAAAFGQRRKMLRGSLKPLGGETLLRQAGIDPERRAETLSVAEFERLASFLPE